VACRLIGTTKSQATDPARKRTIELDEALLFNYKMTIMTHLLASQNSYFNWHTIKSRFKALGIYNF